MLICPDCSAEWVPIDRACKSCGFRPETIDGFIAWAPDIVRQEVGFPAENFSALTGVEAKHFWFRTRNSLIIWALKNYFPAFESLLEVGCGTGFVLSEIAQIFPGARLVGSEIFTSGLLFAAKRMPEVELLQADARRLPFADEFEVVSAFDVIEHVKEDDVVLCNLYRAVKPGGGCLITVPQHRWLWSPIDIEACHERRYEVGSLHQKIESVGFRILTSTSFVTFLLPIMLFSRLLNRHSANSEGAYELRINPTTNALFEAVMGLERSTIMLGARWMVGGSRLVVAVKPRS